jgi:RNA polymerase sigma factor (sigma-70 family)
MPDANDMDLVREFARNNSEAAFAELVRRHLNLVYSVARRCTGNDGDAHDVTQAVFIILARKAAGLREKTLLTGWLYETTRFAAARLLRTNARRHAREQEAYMQSTLTEADTAAVWEQLSPHLEAAMGRLNAADRALLVLRFYENKTGPEAAALLGIREDAAHKRVARAIEKLRKFFAQRGVTLTATAIAGAVSANSVQAAPVALVKTISAIAVAKGAAAGTATLTLVKGALKLMAWTKMQTAIVIGAAAILVASTTAYVIGLSQSHPSRYQLEGNVVFDSYNNFGQSVLEIKRDFAVTVDGSRWLITTTNRNSNGGVLTSWATGSTNGEEIIYAIYYGNNTNFVTAVIESNTVPSGCEDGVSQYLWLMLASSVYLDRVKTSQLPPVYDPVFSILFDKDLKYPVFLDRLTNSPNLPRQIAYMNDGFYRTRDRENKTTELLKIAPPFDKGFTNAVFAVSGVTHYGNMEFPTGFKFLEYAPSFNFAGQSEASHSAPIVGSRSDMVLSTKRKMEVSITRISVPESTTSLLPSIPKNASVVVQDRRLMNAKIPFGFATYDIQNGKWKTIYELKSIVKYPSDVRKNYVYFRIYIVLAASLLIFIPAIYLTQKKRN